MTMLPQLDIGTCFAAGTAIDSPFFAVVPLFSDEPAKIHTATADKKARTFNEGPLDRSDRIPIA
jgi:hypothetical protein